MLPAFWRKQMKEQFNTHLTMQTIALCCPLLQRKTRGSSSCPLCIPKKRERRGYWKRRNRRILQPRKKWCGQSWSNVQLVHHGKKNKPVANEALLWNNWQRCLERICYFHWKYAQLWRTLEKEATKILEGPGPCFGHSKRTSEIRSAANIARCETGHSELLHFTGTLTSSKQHPASFSTAQEMLHLSQIKGQENQIHL